MTFLTDLAEVLQNSNNALAGVFLRNHAKEIVALLEAAEGKKEWVGLTDEEIDTALPGYPVDYKDQFARAIEAILKEKNG
jgi:hypothetical protein